MKNLIDRDRVIEWLRHLREDYDNAQKTHDFNIKFLQGLKTAFAWIEDSVMQMPIENPTQEEIPNDKICGNCMNYRQRGLWGCQIGWVRARVEDNNIERIVALGMRSTDGASCPDWKEKPKENLEFPQCQTCEYWQNKYWSIGNTYLCRRGHIVRPTDTLTELSHCWKKPKETPQVPKCQLCANWQDCADWTKIVEETAFPQCQTCANWQDKIHHIISTDEPVYECKKLKLVFPTDTRTGICGCWEKPKEKKRIWSCLNCGEDIFYRNPCYVHLKSDHVGCEAEKKAYPNNIAIPHPDKPMRME